ncbi:Cadherin-like beta sandwich domain-containing protein [Arthrobacter sp. cf158]|uniref:cadherin-like beta sandwich domain-containing protein n=1 Tax=Arthrobacter sp. cf158 TaxID=1761744 RepID=UPI0008985732|nr:cadherin-like beta sandwich domain-containing protein [Arthrobacter sp. cf158]SDX50074.1 Cadherin-like beta sandwich domain-containing protein [Arthrobacter sp. cf158]
MATDVAAAARSGNTWHAAVPAGTDHLRITVTPTAAAVAGITIGGVPVQPGVESEPLALVEGTNTIPVVVTAEDGTTRQEYSVVVERGFLDADATLSKLSVTGSNLSPEFTSDTEEYSVELPSGSTSLTVIPTTTATQSELDVDGTSVQSGTGHALAVVDGQVVKIAVASADGTARTVYSLIVSVPAPPVTDPAPPACGVLSTTSGWAHGLHDGNFQVTMNLWWGTNARTFRLFENGVLMATVPLTADGVSAQNATVDISNRLNGTYAYTGELVNSAGSTATTTVAVKVADAAPGQPVVRVAGSGAQRTVVADLWWGTNASSYRIFDNGVLVAEGALAPSTPNAQHVETPLTMASGEHVVTAVFANHAGETSSKPLKVAVP